MNVCEKDAWTLYLDQESQPQIIKISYIYNYEHTTFTDYWMIFLSQKIQYAFNIRNFIKLRNTHKIFLQPSHVDKSLFFCLRFWDHHKNNIPDREQINPGSWGEGLCPKWCCLEKVWNFDVVRYTANMEFKRGWAWIQETSPPLCRTPAGASDTDCLQNYHMNTFLSWDRTVDVVWKFPPPTKISLNI